MEAEIAAGNLNGYVVGPYLYQSFVKNDTGADIVTRLTVTGQRTVGQGSDRFCLFGDDNMALELIVTDVGDLTIPEATYAISLD